MSEESGFIGRLFGLYKGIGGGIGKTICLAITAAILVVACPIAAVKVIRNCRKKG